MNRSRDKVRCALNHQNAGSIPVDFGSTAVTGIHCRIVEALRNYYGLAPRPVKIVDPKISSIWIRLVCTNRRPLGGNGCWCLKQWI